jgi:hypothetical protein
MEVSIRIRLLPFSRLLSRWAETPSTHPQAFLLVLPQYQRYACGTKCSVNWPSTVQLREIFVIQLRVLSAARSQTLTTPDEARRIAV